jgi:hypothetical protein
MKNIILKGILEGEDILPDEYPIHYDYFYVCDGEVEVSPFGGGSVVRDWKQCDGFKEIRRCNLEARNIR